MTHPNPAAFAARLRDIASEADGVGNARLEYAEEGERFAHPLGSTETERAIGNLLKSHAAALLAAAALIEAQAALLARAREALAVVDEARSKCPVNKRGFAGGTCPACGASARETCNKITVAEGFFVAAARAALLEGRT